MPDLLRADGWHVVTLAEHYGIPADESVEDTQWLRLAGTNGWPVLMKDDRIRYRSSEREALLQHSVRAFCITSGNLTAAAMAGLFIERRAQIWQFAQEPGAAVFALTRNNIRRVGLDD